MSDTILEATEKQPQILDQLLAIGQAIQRNITQNPKSVYQLIVETICRLSGADCAVLYPYHPAFGEFYDLDNVAAYGLRYESQLVERVDKVKGLAARVHREGEVIREEVEQEDPQILQTSPFITREGIKAFMGLSLKFGDNIVGLLYVDYRKPHHYSEEERRIIRLLGQQAALAVSNSWSYRLADIRAEAVAKLKAIGQDLIAIKSPSEKLESILNRIANSAQEVLGADMVDLYQYNQVQGKFILPPASVGKRQYPHVSKSKIYDDDVILEAVAKRKPQYFQNSQETSWLVRTYGVVREGIPRQRFVIREGIVSSAAIPLIAGGETVGVMFVNYRTSQLFGPEQRNVIEVFATQAAIAIYNARYYQLPQEKPSLETVPEADRILKPEDVINSVLDQLSDIVEYDSASIQLIQGDTRIQVGGRGFAEQEFHPEHLSNVSRDPLIKKIVTSLSPLVIGDVNKHPSWKRTPQTHHVNSWMGVPLIIRDQVVGLLTLDHHRTGYYTSKSSQAIVGFAKKVATTIYNSHLFNIFDRRVEAFTALNRVGQALTSDLRLQEAEILELICAQTGKLVDAQEMYIALCDETANTIRFGILMKGGQQADITEETDFQPRRINPTEVGKTEAVILGRRPILHRTRAEEIAWYSQPGRRAYTGQVAASHLAVPMMIGQRVLGAIAVYNWERERAYDELDRQVLFSMASQAAIALENGRLYQGLERQVETLIALNEVGRALTSDIRLKEDEILALIYRQARDRAHTQNVNIVLYDEKTNTLTFKLVMERGQQVDIKQEQRFAPREINKVEVGKTEEIILTGRPILHKTRAETAGWYKEPGHRDYNMAGEISASHLAVPMVLGQKVIGVIAVYDWEQEYAYDELDQQALSVIAGQAAIALDNANLYARRIRDIEALKEIGQILTSGIRLRQDEILGSVYEQARELTRTQEIYIALYDDKTNTIRFGPAMEKGKPVRIDPRPANMEKRGKTEEVIFTKKAILHQTKQESEGWYLQAGHQEFRGSVAPSWLGVPMMVDKEVLGMIAVYDWEREYAYDELDKQVLSAMASQAAIALGNLKLLEELTAAQRLATLGTAMAAIQHRINNTLNIIGPNIIRLRRRVDTSDETIREILDIIERNTRYTSDYIQHIQEPLKEEAKTQQIDINATLRDTHERISEQYQNKPEFGLVKVVYRLEDTLPLIEAFAGQVAEVFRNLIENSYKAMGANGGVLTIASRQVDDWLEAKIQDTGPGIPPPIRERLFLKPAPSKQSGQSGQGSGLGLWLSALLLQRYRGEIKVADTGPQGTTMLVRLPIIKS